MQKTVLITGASGDIGKAIATTFANNGYTVIGTYHDNRESILELAESLGNNFYYYKCDHSDFDQSINLINSINNANLNIDILINNVGISVIGLLQDLDSNSWKNLWNTNVTSVVSLSKSVIPLFLKQGHGKIINISSVWGDRGASCEVGYSATKGAINAFTKALAKELAPSNIQVNAVSCGIIDTKMNKHLSTEDLQDIIDDIPASRIGSPKDVANTVYSIANCSSYMTGQIIAVDGGWQV